MSPIKHSITWEQQQKARQRLDRETGVIIKDWGGKLPFALVYPNDYYIGMSNLGIQAIYGWLNQHDNIVCERVFWDRENRDSGQLPLSVESQRPLTDFAVLAFSLNYELDYLNIAPILRTSGIPLFSADRNEEHPLIIAGGPCITANPMPVSPFFDCLCSGEAEALLPPMLPVLVDGISGKRDDLLKALTALPGLYVPRFHPLNPAVRRWAQNLDDFPVHSIVLTPDTELGDLYLIEVQRGCAHGCHFCLVSRAFSPLRFRSVDILVRQAEEGLKSRRRLGLMGPAVTDHPLIEALFAELLRMGAQLSISSLRLTSLTPRIMEQMVQGGMRSIALAPEAGSECLRRSINKCISEARFLDAVRLAAEKGMQQLKLYFMIGLPQETGEDIQAIVDLTLAGKAIIEDRRGRTRLILNLSQFVPKAGTVFQRQPMADLAVLRERLGFLKSKLAHKGIQIKSESPQWSEVQAVLSRGDADLAQVLVDIEKGSLQEWRNAAEKHGLDIDHYAHRTWGDEAALPWERT